MQNVFHTFKFLSRVHDALYAVELRLAETARARHSAIAAGVLARRRAQLRAQANAES